MTFLLESGFSQTVEILATSHIVLGCMSLIQWRRLSRWVYHSTILAEPNIYVYSQCEFISQGR